MHAYVQDISELDTQNHAGLNSRLRGNCLDNITDYIDHCLNLDSHIVYMEELYLV